MLTAKLLFVSLIWGSIGVGYFIYGRRQQSVGAMTGGLLMIGASYFIGSALMMSLACFGIVAAVYWLARQGY